MKKINFVVTDLLNQEIEKVMSWMGFSNKSEFFRMLAHNYIKEVKIPTGAKALQGSGDALTEKEKTILRNFQRRPQSIDQLIEETGFSITEVSVLLTQLLLKNRAIQTGAYWTIKI